MALFTGQLRDDRKQNKRDWEWNAEKATFEMRTLDRCSKDKASAHGNTRSTNWANSISN